MSREIRDLQVLQTEFEQKARSAIFEGRTDDAEKAMGDVRDLKARISMMEELAASEVEAAKGQPAGQVKDEVDLDTRYRAAFLKAIRNRKFNEDDRDAVRSYEQRHGIRSAVMHEGGATGQDDGDSALVVPIDRQTRINELRRSLDDLTQYITVETVSTLSGSRVLEANGAMTPFVAVDEYGKINNADNPKFQSIPYELVKRAGILPLTNELLADNDTNLLGYVDNWLARKAVVTYNTEIVTLLKTLKDGNEWVTVGDLKTALNVTLDPALAASAIFLVNQDAYNWLDQQLDGNGRYLLQIDPTAPGRKMLFGRPVAIVSNRYLPTDGGDPGSAPVILGDLKQLMVQFTRGQFELASSNIGGDAWRYHTTELRVITRDDFVLWDEDAAVYGEIDPTDLPDGDDE